MEYCENKKIFCKNYEDVCINCGTVHDYKYINKISFRDYNMNMSNILFYCTLKKLMIIQYYFLIIHWKALENYVI